MSANCVPLTQRSIGPALKVGDVLNRARDALDDRQTDALEGLVAGHADLPMRGVLGCASPSLSVVRHAAASGVTLIFCDGHPFYLYDPVWTSQASRPGPVLAAAMVAQKRALIDSSGIAVFRLHSAWQRRYPLSASRSLAVQMRLPEVQAGAGRVLCGKAPSLVQDFAATLKDRGFPAVRVVGPPDTSVARIVVEAGMLTTARLAAILRDPTVDCIVAGDAVEWEAVPYMEDAIAAGRRAALVLVGFRASMEPVGVDIAAWARALVPELPVGWYGEPDPISLLTRSVRS